MSIKHVLDASAVLAVLNNETGANQVIPLLPEAVISSVNLAEVGSKLIENGMDKNTAEIAVSIIGIGKVIEFDEDLAWEAAALRPLTKHLGLSLGDRACLALSSQLKVPAITADKEWARITFCRIILIR